MWHVVLYYIKRYNWLFRSVFIKLCEEKIINRNDTLKARYKNARWKLAELISIFFFFYLTFELVHQTLSNKNYQIAKYAKIRVKNFGCFFRRALWNEFPAYSETNLKVHKNNAKVRALITIFVGLTSVSNTRWP